jgi:Tol biopolymer transport system component
MPLSVVQTQLSAVLTPGISKLTGNRFREIAWGPGGKTILGTSLLLPASESHVLVVSTQDGRIEEVTSEPDVFSLPSWSPHGSIAVITKGVNQIWLLDVQHGSLSYLIEGQGAIFSPDGNEVLVYASNISHPELVQREIHFVDLQGHIRSTLALDFEDDLFSGVKEYLIGLSLSPNGDRLLISLTDYAPDPNKYAIYVAATFTGEVQQLISDDQILFAQWSPDGRSLAYIETNDTSGLGELIVADQEGNCLFRPNLPAKVKRLTWSPDNSDIAFLLWGTIYILDVDAFSTSEEAAGRCQ